MEESKHIPNDAIVSEASLAKEIVDSRKAWFFSGRCARGTVYPDGTINEDSGSSQTGAGDPESEISFYKRASTIYDLQTDNLFYARKCFDQAFPTGNDDPESLVITTMPSHEGGFTEVLIAGKSATLDVRQQMIPFLLIQRITNQAAEKLIDKLKSDPDFFDIYFKKAFPNMDSDKEKYNGLYRLLANKLIIVNQNMIEKLKTLCPAKPAYPEVPNKYLEVRFTIAVCQQIYSESENKIFTTPSGVGTLEDFSLIKRVYGS